MLRQKLKDETNEYTILRGVDDEAMDIQSLLLRY